MKSNVLSRCNWLQPVLAGVSGHTHGMTAPQKGIIKNVMVLMIYGLCGLTNAAPRELMREVGRFSFLE